MAVRVNIQGTIYPPEGAVVSVFDRGFLFGDGVFETCRTYGGRPFMLQAHLQRLIRSADALGICLPDLGWLRDQIDATLAAAGNVESVLRVIVTRGVGPSFGLDPTGCDAPTSLVLVRPFEPLDSATLAGIDIAIPTVRRVGPRALPGWVKSGNYLNQIQALAEGRRKGAWEVVMLDDQGFLAEGSSSNVFFMRGDVLCTPAVSVGILPGLTRALVLALARQAAIPTREGLFRPADLWSAEEIFITSTLKEVLPVRSIDGQPTTRSPGPVTRALQESYRLLADRFGRGEVSEEEIGELLGEAEGGSEEAT